MDTNLIIKPAISIVMSVYNDSRYIDEAIKSILTQTFKDFEFIIINDGSTDNSLSKIKKYKDERIMIINQKNIGLVASLNKGIAVARSDIIARQDSDDISLPDRLEKEIGLLKKNTDCIIVGSSMITIDESGNKRNTHKVLLNNPELKHELLVRSPFAHGSVIFRKKAFFESKGYLSADWPAEDYGLWIRMSSCGEFMNIDEPLYKYRENSSGISQQNHKNQILATQRLQDEAWKYKIISKIDTSIYDRVPMGSYRTERISDNIVKTLHKSIKQFDIVTALRLIFVILTDRNIFKNSAKILLYKLNCKHG
jgi:glycosyltransferase involved in cell wall biosynthesis